MAEEIKVSFVPWGELKPDAKLFNNDGLVNALNVAPVHGNYVAAQRWLVDFTLTPFSDEPYGMHVHFGGGSTWYSYVGTITKLYQVSSAFVATDKTRAVGGNYATSGSGGENGWQGTSFGDAIIMTNYVDDPQLLTSPAAANFVKLAQSGGGNPGMDPKAKFVFPVRNNLFLANLNLSAGFDTLPSGANPTVVAWSQTDNVRQFGSYAVTPSLTQTGYQPLSYDFGHITGGIGGDYGLVALQRGWVRVDGPPYVFRPVVVGSGCRYPNSICRLGEDVYFWGASGPSVLRGGDTLEVIGSGKITRTLIDNSSGFSPTFSVSTFQEIRHLGSAVDPANGLVSWIYMESFLGAARGGVMLMYNTREDRFSFVEMSVASSAGVFPDGFGSPGLLFIGSAPDLGASWAPGRDYVGVIKYVQGFPVITPAWQMASPGYTTAGSTNPRLDRAFVQLNPDRATRVRRVRPIYSISGSDPYTATVYVTTKSKPYETATTFSFTTTTDTHGWITTPDTVLGDFHQIGVEFTLTQQPTIVEMEGYEVEYEVGGRYVA